MNARVLGLCLAALLGVRGAASAAANLLPIYIEDNHAGTFYWLAQTIDLDQPCTLVLFDAHNDASGIFDSDEIRGALRNVASLEIRQRLLDRWRSEGAVQCFNWIEPLMPAPIAKVIWVPAYKLAPAEIRERTEEATALLDGHLEGAPRRSGSLRQSYTVMDLENLESSIDPNQPLIVTIDLDYFAGLPIAEQETAFARIWNFASERSNVRAITFAISRPYLSSSDEAYRLLRLALTSALSLPTARIQFEPFLIVPNDHSSLAKKLMMKGEKLPAFDITQAPQELRARILSERDRITVRHHAERWQRLLRIWYDEAPQLHLAIRNHQPSTDNVWRVPADEPAQISLITEPWTARPEHIEWFAVTPKHSRCNVTDLSTEQVGFVANAAPRPAWNELAIGCHDSVLPIGKIDKLFDPTFHCGSLRLRARAIFDGKIRETPVFELRRFIASGFRAAISEQFGLPYLFGSGELSDNCDTGPETNLGADCTNFLVYAMRRQGRGVPWCDPKQLREHVEVITRSAAPGTATIAAEDLQRGMIVHLGTHVAAVMEDRPPVGVLDENDLVAHQLSGTPQMVTLGQLLRGRGQNRFDLFRVPPASASATLLFGGDIMLGRSCAMKIENGMDPFDRIAALLRGACFAAANLECTISNLGESDHPYTFRAPAESAQLLGRAGFNAMGLENNHALDFGVAALHDCAARLLREGIEPVGMKTPAGNACTASFFHGCNEKTIALLAISAFGATSEIATASNHADLNAAIADAQSNASLVACLVHWGTENSENVSDEQRQLARWLIDHGVDLVVGSHPHCVQPLDSYHGRPIAYSLGNLVFDGAPTVASWNRGALLKVDLNERAKISSVSLIPIVLDNGFPQVNRSQDNRLHRR